MSVIKEEEQIASCLTAIINCFDVTMDNEKKSCMWYFINVFLKRCFLNQQQKYHTVSILSD